MTVTFNIAPWPVGSGRRAVELEPKPEMLEAISAAVATELKRLGESPLTVTVNVQLGATILFRQPEEKK
jgi:hypothetical protein